MDDLVKDTLGRPLRDLRVSVIDRCNFRCSYCMPDDRTYRFMPTASLLGFDDIVTLVKVFAAFGVTKIRITGGEPLMRKRLPALIESIAAADGIDDIALTTNGFFLAAHAQALKDAGLRRLTVSLDSLDAALFTQLSGGRSDPQRIQDAIDAAAAIGFPIKINAVIKRGVNESQILPLTTYARQRGYIVRFIEFMDVGNLNAWKTEHVVPSKDVVAAIHSVYPCRPATPNAPGEVASRYHFLDGDGEFGVISSVTQPFCRGCTRARVSANGMLYTCLFASQGHDLKAAMSRPDAAAALAEVVRRVWSARADRYSEQRALAHGGDKVEMYEMGG